MKLDAYTKTILTIIAIALIFLSLGNFILINSINNISSREIHKVEIYKDGKPLGEGLRLSRFNTFPVDIINTVSIENSDD